MASIGKVFWFQNNKWNVALIVIWCPNVHNKSYKFLSHACYLLHPSHKTISFLPFRFDKIFFKVEIPEAHSLLQWRWDFLFSMSVTFFPLFNWRNRSAFFFGEHGIGPRSIELCTCLRTFCFTISQNKSEGTKRTNHIKCV